MLLCAHLMCMRAQTFPVQVSVQLVPPFSGYLNDYAAPGNDNLRIFLTFSDFTQPTYDVKLKFKLTGSNVTIQSKSWYYAGPFTLEPGVPLMLSGSDLAGMLSSANLDYSGINLAQYNQQKVLPEGFYTISVTAYDFLNPLPIQVSNEGITQAWMMLNDPPMTNLPACGSQVQVLTPQNITFSWTPLSMTAPTSALGTEYLFELWEIIPPNNPAGNVVQTSAPIYSVTTSQTMILYGITEPPLQVGWNYVWRVRAYDLDNRALFRNNGYSQVCTFTYGDPNSLLGNLANLTLSAQVLTHRQARCTWDSSSVYASYHLEFRKVNTTNWFPVNTSNSNVRITSLEPQTQYEAEVQGIFPNGDDGPWSNIVTFTTPAQPVLNCGESSPPPAAQNFVPLTQATTGMIWQVGQFEMIVTSLNTTANTMGFYSGLGKVIMPLGVTLNCSFTNIQMGADQVMYAGHVEAITEGVDNWLEQLNASGFVNPEITYSGEIESPNDVQVNILDNTITIGGNTYEYESSEGTAIEDANGTLWIVDTYGNVILTGQTGITFTPPPISDLNTTNGQAIFSANPAQLYGYDHLSISPWANYYMDAHDIKDDSYSKVDWKSVQKGKYDIISVQYSNLNGVIADSIFIYCPSGTIYRAQGSGVNRYFYVVGGDANDRQDLYAAYRNSSGEIVNIGKLCVTSFEEETRDIWLVPFGFTNQTAPSINGSTTTSLEHALDSIYQGAVIKWKIHVAPSPIVSSNCDLNHDGKISVSGEGWSRYSDEMESVISELKFQSWYSPSAKYLLITTTPTDSAVPGLQGSMPRKKDFGFIFSNPSNPQFITTVAHELGHGVYSLEHSFEGNAPVPKTSTNNLMDYSSGSTLVHWQWYWMHNPTGWTGLDDGEDDDRVIVDIRELLPFINPDSATFTFMTPAGKPLTIPKQGLESVTFSYGDDWNGCANGTNHNSPVGALSAFKLNGTKYLGTASCETNDFLFYKNEAANKTYIDSLSQGINPAQAIVGHPCVSNGQVVFVITNLNFTEQVSYGENYKGGGPFKDHLLVWNGFNLNSTTTQIQADINPPYSPDAEQYLVDNLDASGCGEIGVSYVLTYAYQINRYPNTYECCIKFDNPITSAVVSPNTLYVPAPTAYSSVPTTAPYEQKEQQLKQLEIDTRVSFKALENKRKSINAELLAITNHGILADSLKSIPPYICIWNAMYASTRIHCIQILIQSNVQGDWLGFGNNYEGLVNDLLRTTEDPLQQDSLLNELSANNCAMIKSLWNVLDLDGLDEFINTITGWLVSRDASRPTFASISSQLYIGNPNTPTRYFQFFKWADQSNASTHIFTTTATWSGGNIDLSTFFDPIKSDNIAGGTAETLLGAYDWVAVEIMEDLPSLGLKEGKKMVVPMIWAMWLSHRTETNDASNKIELITQIVLFLATDYVGNAIMESVFTSFGTGSLLEAKIVGQEVRAVATTSTHTSEVVLDMELGTDNVWTWKQVKWEQGFHTDASVVGKIDGCRFVTPGGQTVQREMLLVETAETICVRDATAVYGGNVFYCTAEDLATTYGGNTLSSELKAEIFQLYNQERWADLEELFAENNLNGGYPPGKGGYNVIDNVPIRAGQKFDRYGNSLGMDGNGKPILGGTFTSPVTNGTPYSFGQRALSGIESSYDLYYEIEVLEDLPFTSQNADVIPWFGQEGNGVQSMWKIPIDESTGYAKTWNKLAEEGKIRITIKSSPSGNFSNFEGTVIGQ